MKKTVVLIFLMMGAVCFFAAVRDAAAEDVTADYSEKNTSKDVVNGNDYVIGPEDLLSIYVWKEESVSQDVPVRIDGKISIPLVNDIQAAGLTPLQLQAVLTQKLKNFIENPTVTVTVKEANSYKAYVSGEVKQPGVYPIRSNMTLVRLMVMAGGFTEWADQKKILILRKSDGGEKRIIADYKKIIEGDAPDMAISPGDVIIVK
jgi:polysaccharide biosynthesis/export protein